MEATIPNQRVKATHGWVFYDGECSFCVAVIARLEPLLRRHHFELEPLQTPGVQRQLGLNPGELLAEMKLLAADEQIYGGANAWLQIARQIWWAWPLFALAQIPGAKIIINAAYRQIAMNRTCFGGKCSIPKKHYHKPNQTN